MGYGSKIDHIIEAASKAHVFHRKSYCPQCREPLTRSAMMAGDSLPTKGDISLCSYCGAVLRFREDLALELCPDSDLEELRREQPDGHEMLMRIRRQVVGTKRSCK